MTINLDIILYICGFIATVTTATAIISKVVKKAVTSMSKDVFESMLKDQNKEINTKISKLTDTLEEHINCSKDNDRIVRDSLLSIIRDRIYQSHIKYTNANCIGAHTMFILDEMYKSYKSLGGNSFIDDLMLELKDLRKVNENDEIPQSSDNS